jgi:UDP-N-acetylmuramyl pentapeptide phosphotransferase/UDP-N-acetylglucosamine-1-phosphate transferase
VIIVVGLLVGLLTVRLLVIWGRDLLDAPALQRRNFRDRPLPTAAGLLVVIAVLGIEAGRGTLGAFCGLLGDDLHEHLMLGDTGANVLGAVLGLAVVLDVGRGPRNVVLIGLVLLTLIAEAVSFSAVIARVPILRRFDMLGRARD